MVDNMTENEGEARPSREQDEFDRELNAALAKYAAAEPRAGLEERVLANLRAEREHGVGRAGWRWHALALAAVTIAVVVALVWRFERQTTERRAGRPTLTMPGGQHLSPEAGAAIASEPGRPTIQATKKSGRPGLRPPQRVLAAAEERPKLEQFPSPQPLSEQERILADYVADYPEHAALIAQARAEALRRDIMDEMRESAGGKDQNLQNQ